MARKEITASFFRRPTLKVAEELVGKYLVRCLGGKTTALRITEVEAYDGFRDRASHVHRGVTPRNEVMFGSAGYFYVYFVYGAHWMLNVVCGPVGYPAAVLLRGAGEISGPGRLTKTLGIDGSFNKREAKRKSSLWFEDRGESMVKIVRVPRVGVDYAGPAWSKKPYRFISHNQTL